MKKLKIGVLFGGKSAEHDVSIKSAENVINALDKSKYEVFPIRISKDGKFNISAVQKFDVIFPVLHGPFGEDGSMQGLLKISGVPFVGPSVLGSAVGMDKDVMKRLLRDSGIPVGKFVTVRKGEEVRFSEVKKKLGMPMFIKPANMGSSIGVSKVTSEAQFAKGLKDAFKYDTKVIVEEFIDGREIECSVMGNEKPAASIPGEIIASQEFYSYDAKYVDSRSVSEIPAKISKEVADKIQKMAIEVFKCLECEGMSRVDFFLKQNGDILVNEINTLPGFTDISMYPKMWEASGLKVSKLLDKLILLAIQRFNRENKIKNTV